MIFPLAQITHTVSCPSSADAQELNELEVYHVYTHSFNIQNYAFSTVKKILCYEKDTLYKMYWECQFAQ